MVEKIQGELPSMNEINKVYELLNNSYYRESVNPEAISIAMDNNLVILMGASDDLFEAYGAISYLTNYAEHGGVNDGSTLTNIEDKALENEAKQLGLKVYWCGEISESSDKLLNYDWQKEGAFSFTVNDDIQFMNFTVLEERGSDEVYCTGIIFKLPKDFKVSESE